MTKNIRTIIKPNERYTEISSGDMTRIAGVAKETSNSKNIHLAVAEIPPGKSSSPHLHLNCESAIYVLAGEGVFVAGKKLDKHNKINEGDFIYVPPDAPHKPINVSNETSLLLLVARNQPTEIVKEIKNENELSINYEQNNDCTVIHSQDTESNASEDKNIIVGVSKSTSNSKAIHMAKIELLSGTSTIPHKHLDSETAIFIQSGKGLFIANDKLDSHLSFTKEDFIYIPEKFNHKISNVDSNNSLSMIVARNNINHNIL